MTLAEIRVDDLVDALQKERSAWIKNASDEGRYETEVEKTTICLLAAFERVLTQVASSARNEA